MKGYYRHILAATAVLLTTAACNKNEPDGPQQVNAPIAISATEAGTTKALLDNGSFKTTGNRIQVYDFVDDGSTTVKHIDAYAGPDVDSNSPMHEYGTTWPFEDKESGEPVMYQWIPGTHKFFGWLAKDANFVTTPMTPETFFGNGFEFNEGEQTLTIPAKTIDYTTPQFDFMYSNVVTTEPQNDPVDMMFSHLFTAISIGVENSTSSFIKIEEFRIEGIPSERGASVNFSGTATAVSYSNWTDGKTITRGLSTDPYEVSPKNLRSNIFNGSTTQEFMMLWPVEAQHLHSTGKITTGEDGTVTYPQDYKMYIKYTPDGKDTYEKRINFPNISWEAGNKYHLTIVFADKMVELRTEVKPWEYEEQEIDYTNEIPSISSGGALAWSETASAVDHEKKMVSIVNAQSAEAMFTLQTPIGGSWIVSLVGDVNAFEVSPATGIIDNNTATVYVKPLIASPTRDYKVQLKFTIRRSDGRMIAADNIIQTSGVYTVVLPRNN